MTWFKPGDEVHGYCRRHHIQFGTLAEYTTVPEGYLAHKPRQLSFEEAAAMPLTALTAHQCLEVLGLRGGETLFVGGGAGGVGHFAVQLGVARGARVIATASERNHDFLRALGADPLDYAARDVAERVRDLAGDGGADAALDIFAGDPREQAFSVLRRGGRLCSIAGPAPEPREGYEVHYVFVRPSGYDLAELDQLVVDGRLRPYVADIYPLERLADAYERLEAGHVRGKLVVTIDRWLSPRPHDRLAAPRGAGSPPARGARGHAPLCPSCVRRPASTGHPPVESRGRGLNHLAPTTRGQAVGRRPVAR